MRILFLNDLRRDMADYMDSLEFDPEYFNETEQRLDMINLLKMKYGKTIEIILESLQEKKQREEQLSDFDAYIAGLRKEVRYAEKEIRCLCRRSNSNPKESCR